MEKQTLGSRIQVARKTANLSQEQLAKALGVTRQAVSNWERNITLPDVQMCEQLSKHLNVTMGELLDYEEKQPKQDVQKFEIANQKLTVICYLVTVALFVTQFVFVFMGISPGEMIVMALGPFFMSSTVFLVFTAALKSNDYTMVAGYDSKIKYRKGAVKRTVSLIQAHVVRSTCLYFVASLVFQLLEMQSLLTIWLFVYIFEIIGGIFIISFKTQESLYEDPMQYEQAKAQSVPMYFGLLNIVIGLMAFFSVCTMFNLENNTPEILIVVLFLMLNMIMTTGVMIYENHRLKRSEVVKYSSSKVQVYSFIGCGGFILAMVISAMINS